MNNRFYEVLVFYKYNKEYANPTLSLRRYKDACKFRDDWNSKVTSDNPDFGYAILMPSFWF